MNINEFKEWMITTDEKYKYQLLSRMQSDCLYFLRCGNGKSKLWGGSIDEHIEYMKTLYNIIAIKPDWLTLSKIYQYQRRMDKKQMEEL